MDLQSWIRIAYKDGARAVSSGPKKAPKIERYVRQEGSKTRVYTEAQKADATFRLGAIACDLTLEDVCAKV